MKELSFKCDAFFIKELIEAKSKTQLKQWKKNKIITNDNETKIKYVKKKAQV